MSPRPSKDFEEGKKPERADWSTKRGTDNEELLKKAVRPASTESHEEQDHTAPRKRGKTDQPNP